MRRGRPLATDPAKARAWQDRSRQAQQLAPDERQVQAAVFQRDGLRCQLRDHVGTQYHTELASGAVTDPGEVPACWGPLTYHHRRKAGAAGAYTEANGATLCAGHNRWVEDEPDAARLVLPHLVVREGDPEWPELGRRAARRG